MMNPFKRHPNISFGEALILQRMDHIMAQIDDLQAALSAISAQADTLTTDFSSLEEQLTALQNSTPPEVDLSGVIATAQSISAKLGAIADAANVTPPASPAPPVDTSGTDTSGAPAA